MATQPDFPPPDRIQPQSPPEAPPLNPTPERPFVEPPEIRPDVPNVDEPGETPPELVPPIAPQETPAGSRGGYRHLLQTRMSRWNARLPLRAFRRR